MTAARIIVWRHGQTDWNLDNRFQGQADVPLNSLGREQAKVAARALTAYRPSAIYASDLSRAYETAQALAELTDLPITTDPRLREIHVGTWEGKLGSEIRALDPELAERLRRGEEVRRSPTGESPAEVATRMSEALTEIGENAADGSTVVVTCHGLSGRVGAAHFVGLPQTHWRLFGGLSNCAWVSIDRHRSGEYWRIEKYNAVPQSDLVDTIS